MWRISLKTLSNRISMYPPYLYRTESCSGSGVRDVIDVIHYEMAELQNTDIPVYVLEHYAFPEDLETELRDILSLADDEDYPFTFDRGHFLDVVSRMVDEIGRQKGIPVRYALWLAEEDVVRNRYNLPGGTVDRYSVSPVVLSDLGPDGILFGYAEMPAKMD